MANFLLVALFSIREEEKSGLSCESNDYRFSSRRDAILVIVQRLLLMSDVAGKFKQIAQWSIGLAGKATSHGGC